MAVQRDRITVFPPDGETVVVDILDADVSLGTVHAERTRTRTFTLPLSITEATSFFVPAGTGPYAVSVKLDGKEIAGPAGSAVTVSKFPAEVRTKVDADELASLSGGSSAATHYVPADSGNGESVPNNTNTLLTWTEADGEAAHLLDLTDPTQPTFIEAGDYIVNVTVSPDSVPTVNYVSVNVNVNPDSPKTQNYGQIPAGGDQPVSVVASNNVPAGAELYVNLHHTEGAAAIFYLAATVHKVG